MDHEDENVFERLRSKGICKMNFERKSEDT